MIESLDNTHDAVVNACKAWIASGHAPASIIAALIYEAGVLLHLQAPSSEPYEFGEIARSALEAIKDET
jgi:transcription initiation factor TFIIIB Brf1 subunit/transcription initiation factor TFIIB